MPSGHWTATNRIDAAIIDAAAIPPRLMMLLIARATNHNDHVTQSRKMPAPGPPRPRSMSAPNAPRWTPASPALNTMIGTVDPGTNGS